MNRRAFLHTAGIAGAAAALGAQLPAQTQRRPNVIYILADDLGYGELGCTGQKWIRTPCLDRMAAEGMRFTQHYAGSPVCAPSRCVLLTGKHTGHAAIRNNGKPKGAKFERLREKYGCKFPGQNPLPAEEVTLAEKLQQAGYATGAMGKWGLGHWGTSGDPNRQGFDLFYGYNCQVHAHNHYPRYLWRNGKKEPLPGNDRKLTGETHSQDKFIEEAKAFIRGHRNEPFFLYLPFIIPHLSIQVPEETLNEYKGKIPEEDHKHRGYLKHPFPRAGYAAMVTHMDRGIGEVMDLVKQLGLDENTVVIFASDNGPTYRRLGGSDSVFFKSSGPLRGRKGSVYEGGIRVPCIARWPGRIKRDTVSDHVCAFWDVLPTLCQIAGVEPPEDIDGISFAPTLLGQGTQRKHEYLYWEFPAYGGQQALRWGDWKGVRQRMFRGNMKTELYNLATDIAEEHDVAGKHPDVVARIERLMRETRVPSERFPFPALDKPQVKTPNAT
jgi:arylsulfatase